MYSLSSLMLVMLVSPSFTTSWALSPLYCTTPTWESAKPNCTQYGKRHLTAQNTQTLIFKMVIFQSVCPHTTEKKNHFKSLTLTCWSLTNLSITAMMKSLAIAKLLAPILSELSTTKVMFRGPHLHSKQTQSSKISILRTTVSLFFFFSLKAQVLIQTK